MTIYLLSLNYFVNDHQAHLYDIACAAWFSFHAVSYLAQGVSKVSRHACLILLTRSTCDYSSALTFVLTPGVSQLQM